MTMKEVKDIREIYNHPDFEALDEKYGPLLRQKTNAEELSAKIFAILSNLPNTYLAEILREDSICSNCNQPIDAVILARPPEEGKNTVGYKVCCGKKFGHIKEE